MCTLTRCIFRHRLSTHTICSDGTVVLPVVAIGWHISVLTTIGSHKNAAVNDMLKKQILTPNYFNKSFSVSSEIVAL